MTAKKFQFFVEEVRLSFHELKSFEEVNDLFSLLDEYLDFARKSGLFTRYQYLLGRDTLEDAFKERCIELNHSPISEV